MPDSWRCIAISFFLLLMSALFSYSGAYIKALSEKKLEGDAEDGNKRAKRLFSIIRKGNRTVWSLNCAVVLSGLFASAFFCTGLSGSVSDWTGISVTMSLFILTLIFGIIFILLVIVFPGRLASRDTRSSENYKMSGFITFTVFIFMPLSIAMEAVSNIMLRIFGIDPRKLDENITEDEILQMVDISEESGNIESGEKEMIENIFDFTDITAADVMTHRTSMAAIDINASNDEIIDLIEQTGFSRFPVYQDDPDNIIGILNARRFFLNLRKKQPLQLKNLLYVPYLIPESVHADTLLHEMQKNKIHMAVVLDEYGGTSGIVTMEDLLEEIVGNIYDETDDPASDQEIIKLGENLWRIAGSTDIGTIAEELDVDLDEDEEYDTLGGLVFSCLTVIPVDGCCPVVDVNGLHIEVEKLEDRRVEWALVSKISEEKAE